MPTINFAGIASGIDTNALIEAILNADRRVKIAPLDKKVIEIDKQSKKMEELKALYVELKDLGTDMRIINGGALTKTAASTDETVATATAANSANNTSFQVTVDTIASNSTASFNDTFATGDTIINGAAAASTVTFDIGTGSELETVAINVDNTTTVSQFVNSFNDTSTKGIATVVNVGTSSSPSYKIVITTLNEGTFKGDIALISDPSTFFALGSTINHATDATFSVTGIAGTITRSSNTVSDVIPGVTMQLKKGGTVSTNIAVNDDVEGSTAAVQKFVDKYNEIVAFTKENNLIAPPGDNPNGLNVFGPLAKTSLDNNALSAIRTALASASYSNGSEIRILADLGITTQQDGTIKFNTNTFSGAIGKESKSAKEILGALGESLGALASAGGVIDNFTRFGGLFQVSTDSAKQQIDSLNKRIEDAESALAQKEQSLLTKFAKLESLVGKLQGQQAALTSALASLKFN